MKIFINQDAYLTEFNVHKKYAVSELILDLVWTHSNIIAEVAINLYQKNNLDPAVYNLGIVTQAALLHDIGVYACDGFEWLTNQPPFSKPYVQHTLVGAEILKKEGFCSEVVAGAYVHAGVGLTKDDVTKFGLQLPAGDYLPTTPTQRLITYAAKFHSKAPKFKTATEIRESLSKYGNNKQKAFDDLVNEYGTPDLEPIIKKYEAWHQGFEYTTNQLTNLQKPNLNSAGIAT